MPQHCSEGRIEKSYGVEWSEGVYNGARSRIFSRCKQSTEDCLPWRLRGVSKRNRLGKERKFCTCCD